MENSTLRCKMQVSSVMHRKNAKGETEYEEVELLAVTSGSDENKQFSKWTPSANFKIIITNPSAIGKLSSGHEYYVDFTPAGENA